MPAGSSLTGQHISSAIHIGSAMVNGTTIVRSQKGQDMATYIMLSTLTDDGRETIHDRPERITEVNQEIESMGARLVSQWAVLGPYDFVNVVEAPDNETIARLSVALGARGTIAFLTMPAIEIADFISALRSGGSGQTDS